MLKNLKSGLLKKKSDDELIKLISQGSESGFQVLFERHASLVLGFSKKMLGGLDKAEEASQEVWLKVVRNAESYDPRGQFKSWLMRVTKNHCLNVLRKDARLVFTDKVVEIPPENIKDAEEAMFLSLSMKDLSEALDQLPDTQRVALTLLATTEPSYEDLAEEMGVSLGALKSIVHRGRKSLKVILERGVAV
jgi:RNA polymerase sigma-70 factor (ECF subfamily)